MGFTEHVPALGSVFRSFLHPNAEPRTLRPSERSSIPRSRLQSSKRARSNWDDGANEKLKQMVQCCKNEHQQCSPQLLRDLLYHLGGFGPYSTRTITRHLNMILPKKNTNAEILITKMTFLLLKYII